MDFVMDNDPKTDAKDQADIEAVRNQPRLSDDPRFKRPEFDPNDAPSTVDNISRIAERFKSRDDGSRNKTESKTESKAGEKTWSKADKEDRLIQNYIQHLNLVINWGTYNEFLEAKEIIKMAQIKSHMEVSKHPQILEVRALYDKIVKIIRKIYNPIEVEKWFKAVNDEIADSKARNNQSALKCPIISCSDVTSDNKAKPKILCAIIALRSLLEEKKFQLREDVWKSYSVITDENGKEQYQSRQVDSILREWRNYIYERKSVMYSMDIIKDAYHQIAKDNEFHSLQENKHSRYQMGWC
jgi:hypothetical protein